MGGVYRQEGGARKLLGEKNERERGRERIVSGHDIFFSGKETAVSFFLFFRSFFLFAMDKNTIVKNIFFY